MAALAKKQKVRVGLWHNYRRAPATALAAQMIARGDLGAIRQVRAVYLQDWLSDGVGAGELAHQQEDLRQRRARRPQCAPDRPDARAHRPRVRVRVRRAADVHQGAPDGNGGKAKVDVDDAFLFLAKFKGGAIGTYEATRTAPGRKNHNCIEISGEKGSLRWNLERMNELEVFSLADRATRRASAPSCAWTRCIPYAANWWPDGHIVGYEHTFVHHVVDFVRALHSGEPFAPTSTTASPCRRARGRAASRRRRAPGSRCRSKARAIYPPASPFGVPPMMKGPGIFLAQFMSDKAPLNRFDTACKWAADLDYVGRAGAVVGRALHRPQEGGREQGLLRRPARHRRRQRRRDQRAQHAPAGPAGRGASGLRVDVPGVRAAEVNTPRR
jgi:hypothetical protein